MRLLIISQYFWPEPFIINDLCRQLKNLGHDIAVLTGKPNYPDGDIYPGYSAKDVQCEVFNGIEVMRVPLRPRRQPTSKNLLLNYLSFIWSGLRYFPGMVKNRRVDAILVFAPSPITSAIPAILLKRLKKTHLAIWVQDLWPESMAATGHIQHPLLLKLVRGMVRVIYKFSDTLLIQSKAFLKPISKLAATDKVVYYPNSMQVVQLEAASTNLPSDLVGLLESRFCVVFAGNIGKAQAMETIVDAVRQLADKDIVIVLVGSGSMSDWVAEQKKLYSLHNLVLVGRFPMNAMPEIYKRASGLLVTLKQDEILGYTVPSKIQAYLAAGKPIIASMDGEGARIVEEAEAGYTCPAEDDEALADSILRLYASLPETRKAMGENGYRYFMEHFEMNRQAENLVNILQARINAQESP